MHCTIHQPNCSFFAMCISLMSCFLDYELYGDEFYEITSQLRLKNLLQMIKTVCDVRHKHVRLDGDLSLFNLPSRRGPGRARDPSPVDLRRTRSSIPIVQFHQFGLRNDVRCSCLRILHVLLIILRWPISVSVCNSVRLDWIQGDSWSLAEACARLSDVLVAHNSDFPTMELRSMKKVFFF